MSKLSCTKKTLEISTIALLPDRHLQIDFCQFSQEPTQRRLEENPFVAIDPRPDPEELSHAPTSQVPRIHDSCHTIPDTVYSLAYSIHLPYETLLHMFTFNLSINNQKIASLIGATQRSNGNERIISKT